MLDTLRPPTDNLYKFMAVSGVLLAALCSTLPWLRLASIDQEVNDLGVATAVSAAHVDYRQYMAERHSRLLDEYADAVQAGAPNTSALAESSSRARDDLAEAQLNADLALAQIADRDHRFEALFGRHRTLEWVALGGSMLGLALAASGFYMWYDRVQRHLDAALASQGELGAVEPEPSE